MAVLSLSLRNDFDELSNLAEQVTTFLEAHEVSAEAVFAANLAIEELVTNIIKYGYDDKEAHEIHLDLKLADGALAIEIRDDGHEFDPFAQPEPDTSLPAAERNIGGLGIHFVRKMLDACHYERREGVNVVSVSKNL